MAPDESVWGREGMEDLFKSRKVSVTNGYGRVPKIWEYHCPNAG